MLQPTLLCDATDTQTGASIVTIFFLSLFSALILADAFISAYALAKTLQRYVVVTDSDPKECANVAVLNVVKL